MAGGSGSVVGTLLGVLIMSLLKTGLPFVGLQANWQQIITGIILKYKNANERKSTYNPLRIKFMPLCSSKISRMGA